MHTVSEAISQMSIWFKSGLLQGTQCLRFYAPSCNKSWEAYWFQLVRASVRACVRPFVQALVLILNVWMPHLK